MPVDRNALLEDLKRTVVEVTFVKLDGSVREMRATLNSRFIPPIEEQRTEKETDVDAPGEESNRIVVWDTGNKGWRSFRIDRILHVQGVNTE